MVLSEKSRSTIFEYFVHTPLGEEATAEMIANLDTPSLDDLVTKDYLDAQLFGGRLETHTKISSLHEEMHREISGLRQEMHTGFAEIRQEMHAGFAAAHDELHREINGLRQEMHAGFAAAHDELHREINGLRQEMHAGFAAAHDELHREINDLRKEMHTLFLWSIGTTVSMSGVLAGLIVAFH